MLSSPFPCLHIHNIFIFTPSVFLSLLFSTSFLPYFSHNLQLGECALLNKPTSEYDPTIFSSVSFTSKVIYLFCSSGKSPNTRVERVALLFHIWEGLISNLSHETNNSYLVHGFFSVPAVRSHDSTSNRVTGFFHILSNRTFNKHTAIQDHNISDILIYLTAIEMTPSCSSTVSNYTQTMHRTTQ
jgi:hypothetical protein